MSRRRTGGNVIKETDTNGTKFGGADTETPETPDKNLTDPKFTLMEEIMLIGLNEDSGCTSFWNDCISSGLRAAIIIELTMRGLITLEKKALYSRSLSSRKIQVVPSTTKTNDVLLDETLKHMRSGTSATIDEWIGLLTGESWNPLCLTYQLRQTRERLAKGLVEKGVLTSEKTDFYLFNMVSHPIKPDQIIVKSNIVRKVQSSVLDKWTNDVQKLDKRCLALLILAHGSDVLENAFDPLNDEQHETAWARVTNILESDREKEASRPGSTAIDEVIWAVCHYFHNRTT